MQHFMWLILKDKTGFGDVAQQQKIEGGLPEYRGIS